jgi:hypothetical protein
MVEKVVYDPKEHAEAEKNVGKKSAKNPKPAKSTKKAKKAAKSSKAQKKNVEPEERVTQFKAKVNKYGFIHVPKRAWTSLPFEMEKPLMARIEGEKLVIAVATENQTK